MGLAAIACPTESFEIAPLGIEILEPLVGLGIELVGLVSAGEDPAFPKRLVFSEAVAFVLGFQPVVAELDIPALAVAVLGMQLTFVDILVAVAILGIELIDPISVVVHTDFARIDSPLFDHIALSASPPIVFRIVAFVVSHMTVVVCHPSDTAHSTRICSSQALLALAEGQSCP